jgi:hypothetical protein
VLEERGILMELLPMKDLPKEVKAAILVELGYSSDGPFVVGKDGKIVIDPYTLDPVKVDNMLILPGSEVILDNNPLSVASYFEEHGELI